MPRVPRLLPRAAAVLSLALLLPLSACSAGDTGGGGSTDSGGERIIEHAYGQTSVPEDPQRVVALGLTDVDNAIAVGVTPVIATDWFGEGLNPWAAELADGQPAPSQKEVSGDYVFDYDAILEAEPDLIFANDGMTEDQYDRLSRIAATVGPAEASGGTVWKESLERTGEILGRQEEAAAVIEETQSALAAVRQAHPEYGDLTVGIGFAPGPDYQASLATVDSFRTQALMELGFQPSEGVKEVARLDTGEGDMPYVSEENLGLLEAAVLFQYFYAEEQRTDALNEPLYARLKVVQEGRVIWMPADVGNALTFGTAIALQYVADKVPPLVDELPTP